MVAGALQDQTEFVADEFDTSFTEGDVDEFLHVLDSSIEKLRTQIEDETLENLFRGEYGLLKESMTRDNLQPEPFTQSAVIEPILESLNYETDPEASTLTKERGQRADYTVSLRRYSDIESTRLLIEAEPINKSLDTRGHGVNQVENWLRQRDFESDFGFATDGLKWVFIRYDPDSYTSDRIEYIDLSEVYLEIHQSRSTEITDPVREIVTDEQIDTIERFLTTFKYDNFVAIASDAKRVIKKTQKSITDDFYDDYIRYVFGVIDEEDEDRAKRSLIGEGIIAPESASPEEIRLFAVKVMNRLIFIKFLEDKGIVQPSNLLKTFQSTYDDGIYPDTLYKTFVEKLFFDVMNTKQEHRSSQIKRIDLFQDIPYLNGGLFRPYIGEDEEVDEREFDVRDSVLNSIIDLLEDYQFSADGGPTDLDPSVLGNVFEKTINYLTTDSANRNKELGAYYTPSEITRFSAEQTVNPALLEKFETYLSEERDWPEAEAQGYESVYGLIDDIPPSNSLITGLLGVVDELRVVDPACGSGHYLTSVLEEIVSIRQALYAQQEAYPDTHRLRKSTVQNNIYGVDIVGPAVEIAKLRCWLSIIGDLSEEDVEEFDQEELALPNIAFNLRKGNSLIGFTRFPESTGEGGYTLEAFSEEGVRSQFQDVIEQIRLYEKAGKEGLTDKAEEHRRKANELLEEYRPELDSLIYDEFKDLKISADEETLREDYGEQIDEEILEQIWGKLSTGIEKEDIDEFDTFHWILEFAEVYAHGGFDVIVGNPPWEVLTSNREEYFSKYDAVFRTRPLTEKREIETELLAQPGIARGWIEHQRRMDILSAYFKESQSYKLQSPDVGGQAKADLSMLFLERVFSLTGDNGYVAKLFPGKLFTGTGNKDLRKHLLSKTAVGYIVGFENKGIFDEIHNQYKFGVVTYKNSGSTDQLRVKFLNRDTDVLQDVEAQTFNVPVDVLMNYSPQTLIFPQITKEEEVPLLKKFVKHPPINQPKSDSWYIDLYKEELNRTRDSDRFVEDKSQGDYPVYGGGNIWQFAYDNTFWDNLEPPTLWSVEEDVDPDKSAKRRIREKNSKRLKKELYEAFEGSGSQIGFVRDLLKKHRGTEFSEEDVLLDCTTYRIGIREISNNTNERSSVASVLPPGIVCHHKCPTIRPYEINPDLEDLKETPAHGVYERIFSNEELFATVGILNSIPFDYIVRTKLDTSLSMNMFEECQAPRLTSGDEWFEYIWDRAARLNAYGDKFEKIRDELPGNIDSATSVDTRKQLQVEIDAAAFHAYDFSADEVNFILEDFHRVQNPRIMTEDYFSRVSRKYQKLSGR